MSRILGICFSVLLIALSACTTTTGSVAGDGSKAVRMKRWSDATISKRHLDEVNSYRANAGLSALVLSEELQKASKAHAQDMSRQNRPWHFGSDGSSPLLRATRAGFLGEVRGENIAETFESDGFTLNAWMQDPLTRDVILDPSATYLGISYYQESGGKIWWVQMLGR